MTHQISPTHGLPAAGMALLLILSTAAVGEAPEVSFRDVADETGLREHIAGIQSHVAAWGDVTGNGLPDVFIGTWGGDLRGHRHYDAPGPPVPGRLYYNVDGRFVHDPESGIEVHGHATAAVFVDLNNNGLLDLYISNHRRHERNELFRNDGGGRFTEIGADSGTCPDDELTSRSIGVIDYDGSGLIDLFVLEGDRGEKRSRLYRNLGDFRFEDVTAEAGLPTDLAGLGVAVGDLTGNGWPDMVVTGVEYSRIFLNEEGTFHEAEHLRPQLVWGPRNTADDKHCGVVLGDLNNNGRLDIVIGHHDRTPWRWPRPLTLLLNEGAGQGRLVLRDVTSEAGFGPVGTKLPHVEIHDFANRGALDVYAAVLRRYDSGAEQQLLIYHRVGIDEDGTPRFAAPALETLDFPHEEHAEMNVHEIAAGGALRYFGFGPAADFDGDGRLDILLVAWWPRLESHLLRNMTENDNRYLRVRVEGGERLNRMGIGAKVSIYEPGGIGDPDALLGFSEISTGYGYASGQEAMAHFGLGERERCDVLIELPHGGGRIERRDVPANQTLVVRETEQD